MKTKGKLKEINLSLIVSNNLAKRNVKIFLIACRKIKVLITIYK